MATARPWIRTVLSVVVMLVLLDLVIQYLLGLWTNVYAPSMFNGNTSFPSLDGHYLNGDVLFLLSVVMLIFAALSKALRYVAPAVVTVVSVFVAGEFGMAYIYSTPNNPLDSFGMGVMFLIAFVSTISLAGLLRRGRGEMAAPSRSEVSPSVAT
jgi:hypothetical protein